MFQHVASCVKFDVTGCLVTGSKAHRPWYSSEGLQYQCCRAGTAVCRAVIDEGVHLLLAPGLRVPSLSLWAQMIGTGHLAVHQTM